MPYRKTNILLASPAEPAAEAILRTINIEKMFAKICRTPRDVHTEISRGIVHAIIVSSALETSGAYNLVHELRNAPITMHIPIYLINDMGRKHEMMVPDGLEVDGTLTGDGFTAGDNRIISFINHIVRRVGEVFHPVSRLMTGAALVDILDTYAHSTKKNSYFLMVKLLGLKAYNLYRTYDDGDRLLATFANMLVETVYALGGENNIIGHIHSDEFIIFSQDKRIENLCKNILVKADRLLRSFYTPYELMQGYITLSGEQKHTHYYLAEAIVAGAEVPTNWDSHFSYLIDLLKELLKKVESEDTGYKMIKL